MKLTDIPNLRRVPNIEHAASAALRDFPAREGDRVYFLAYRAFVFCRDAPPVEAIDLIADDINDHVRLTIESDDGLAVARDRAEREYDRVVETLAACVADRFLEEVAPNTPEMLLGDRLLQEVREEIGGTEWVTTTDRKALFVLSNTRNLTLPTDEGHPADWQRATVGKTLAWLAYRALLNDVVERLRDNSDIKELFGR